MLMCCAGVLYGFMCLALQHFEEREECLVMTPIQAILDYVDIHHLHRELKEEEEEQEQEHGGECVLMSLRKTIQYNAVQCSAVQFSSEV
jgi:hypothetical protein